MAELRENLKAIPSELSGLFDLLLDKIDPAYIPETNIMLSIVLNAARPLTLSEFRYAMAFGSDKDFSSQSDMKTSKEVVQTDLAMMKRIRSRCGGLLEAKVLQDTDSPSNNLPIKIVQFIHQSVKDYFLSGREASNSNIWNSKDLTAQGHATLCQACLKYLCTSDVQEIPSMLEKLHHVPQEDKNTAFAESFPLLDYSVMNWTQHCKEAEKLDLPQISYLVVFSRPSKRHFEIWCEIHDWLKPSNPFGAEMTPLQIAVQFNILSFVRTQVERGVDINTTLSGWFASYLQMAAHFGNEEMVTLLLDHGADVEARGAGCESVLTAACSSGNVNIVKAILKEGADTSTYGMMNSPLWAAALSGKSEVIQILYDHDKSTFENGWSRHLALFQVGKKTLRSVKWENDSEIKVYEAGGGNISELLLTQGVDIFTFGRFALWIQFILMNNSHAVVKKFLTDDPEMCTRRASSGLTLLHLVCLGGDEMAVKLLLDNGADPSAETDDGFTIFDAALANRSESVLRHLLSRGCDLSSVDYSGRTLLHTAAEIGSDAQLYLVIAAKGDVASENLDTGGFIPLHYAMSNPNVTNHKGNLDALIPKALGLNVEACDGSTPLHIAARYGSITHIQWLLEKGANVNVIDSEGRSALHWAAANNNDSADEILELLISHNLSVRATDDAGFTPLHNTLHFSRGPFSPSYRAIFRVQKFKAKVRLLLRRGADLHAQDHCGNTVLHLACAQGSRLVVRLLLDEGVDANLPDFKGCRPIEFAQRDDIRALLGG